MQLHDLPLKAWFSEQEIARMLSALQGVAFLSKELRENFSGKFSAHTRYFSNGDKPLVILVVKRGRAIFGYGRGDTMLGPDELVFFDDSVEHWWTFEHCDLEIFYYRLPVIEKPLKMSGDYCLDNYF